ncbi:hypothetical protein H257_05170 [Aphanomyces astaci]|uniref:Uncharacterized protein n=1 Tax=Aphanomyces astaci TaxID=112090 RepID=W4GS90_APHAT|nr:hypothetical protein H257_05170 [Aphanomyces astaci]ETV82575.1 hypothetical protein H257_05170 [Aphanomyces astaci]KAF0734315.1 hypothetical protein AaE_009158 [Aphanomyces astaci]|eukprot:XP_009828244.1 hypothetical protein H257_05170 [Aphanomyces astaci]
MGNKSSSTGSVGADNRSLSCAWCPGSTGLEHEGPQYKQPPILATKKHSSTLSMYLEASSIASPAEANKQLSDPPTSKGPRNPTRSGSFEFNVEVPEAFRAENLQVRRTSAIRAVSTPPTLDTTPAGPS